MSLVARNALVVPRLRTQGALVSTVDTGATGGYCLGANQRASGGTADVSPSPPPRSVEGRLAPALERLTTRAF
jgi:hypothetical protein